MIRKSILLLAIVTLCCALNAQAGDRAAVRLASYNNSGDCCNPAPECKVYKPCVVYKGCLDCCGPKVHQVLRVKDPCDCCCSVAEIPVCLPACCKDPCVSSKCGCFGRSVVWYDYDCGVSLKIVFNRCGDAVVIYRG